MLKYLVTIKNNTEEISNSLLTEEELSDLLPNLDQQYCILSAQAIFGFEPDWSKFVKQPTFEKGKVIQ